MAIYKRKSLEKYQKQLPKDIKALENYKGVRIKILHKHVNCGYIWKTTPDIILHKGCRCPKCSGNLKKITKTYIKELPKDIEVLEEYVNDKTKILHKHISCGYTWKVTPSSILRNKGCPICAICAISGFNDNLPGSVYCIYFKDLDLYKIGISNNYEKRLKDFGYKPDIIFIREFERGINARKLEAKWKDNIRNYKINTGKLRSGNTETFRY